MVAYSLPQIDRLGHSHIILCGISGYILESLKVMTMSGSGQIERGGGIGAGNFLERDGASKLGIGQAPCVHHGKVMFPSHSSFWQCQENCCHLLKFHEVVWPVACLWTLETQGSGGRMTPWVP